ncbi:hypothetical protein PLEOSDRAFT_1102576 [Pleurotus ostreatus PC15]|uniref:Uncharacterized protein n=1 Tax=Pleurotus ostreatus (strain PC15) TaxID=1137138 RepID=A0A067P5C9_PLEO1|nr:hypothetical protein PLEOSDRAFT_1102576 [Pleurotus ostreatus PC15]
MHSPPSRQCKDPLPLALLTATSETQGSLNSHMNTLRRNCEPKRQNIGATQCQQRVTHLGIARRRLSLAHSSKKAHQRLQGLFKLSLHVLSQRCSSLAPSLSTPILYQSLSLARSLPLLPRQRQHAVHSDIIQQPSTHAHTRQSRHASSANSSSPAFISAQSPTSPLSTIHPQRTTLLTRHSTHTTQPPTIPQNSVRCPSQQTTSPSSRTDSRQNERVQGCADAELKPIRESLLQYRGSALGSQSIHSRPSYTCASTEY